MNPPTDLRTRKRQATRQAILAAATRLFIARGFDEVTVDEIARAADVGRMTVFNHFPRKEDLFFDRDEEGRTLLREALQARGPGITPVEALRRLAHRLVTQRHPAFRFSIEGLGFVETVRRSTALQARARALRDEIAATLAQALTEGAGREPGDVEARLAAGLLLATWSVALVQAHQAFADSGDSAQAAGVFLALVDRGSAGVNAALAGTPYA